MIPIDHNIALDEAEVEIAFIRASGPGGQNVNKVASAAQLRFDIARSRALPEAVRARLLRQLRSRLSRDGVLVITARRFRSQERNRSDALARLAALIRRGAMPPKPRRPTKPSPAQKERRLAAKARRAALKQHRRAAPDE